MSREQALTVKVGATVDPISLWNMTERSHRHIDRFTRVLGVRQEAGQTGVMFAVSTLGGQRIWLDAGWFNLRASA